MLADESGNEMCPHEIPPESSFQEGGAAKLPVVRMDSILRPSYINSTMQVETRFNPEYA
jgi:hypothetical protein